MELLPEIRAMNQELLDWYRQLHRIPELELELPQTVDFVSGQLTRLGVEHWVLPGSTGIIALVGKGSGPVIGIRADMDALEVKEETGLPFASTNNRMHACGHDSHTAILLTVARFLKAHEEELPGRVKLLFQTGEEVLRGAKHMIACGALEDPPVSRMLALHAGSFCGDFPTGHLVLSEEITFYSSDSIRITVTGKGGHAASPHLSVDPIVTAARIVEGLQQLVSREVKPSIPAVVSITHIHAGAETYNVIPNQAVLMGGIRTVGPEMRTYLIRRAEEIARGIGAAMGASVKFEVVDGCPAVINDRNTALTVYQSLEKLFPGEVHWMREANGCSEDTSYYFERVPGCFLFLASMGRDGDGQCYPHHHSKFRLDESVLWRGAAVLAQVALDLMSGGEKPGTGEINGESGGGSHEQN